MTRAGFVGLAGRPNVGKSTLINALVGSRVAVVSDHPQTTRRTVRGVVTDPKQEWQLVFVDLPGVQRPQDALTERMQRRVERGIVEADALLFVVNGEEGVGAGDRFIAEELLAAKQDTPVICCVNKVDRVDQARTVKALSAAAEFEVVDEVFPISARAGAGLFPLTKTLSRLVPEGPLLYPPEQHSDMPENVMMAELVREQVLRRVYDELPHATEVEVTEVERTGERRDALVTVRATVWAESDSQKAIIIGHGGGMVKEIGTMARRELQRELGSQVYLDLNVKVRKKWRRDEALLDRLGIE